MVLCMYRRFQHLLFSGRREIKLQNHGLTKQTNTHTHNDYHMPLGLRPLRHKQLTSNIHVTSVGQSSFVLLSTY